MKLAIGPCLALLVIAIIIAYATAKYLQLSSLKMTTVNENTDVF